MIDLLVSWQLRHGGSSGKDCTVCSQNSKKGVFTIIVVIFLCVYLLSLLNVCNCAINMLLFSLEIKLECFGGNF